MSVRFPEFLQWRRAAVSVSVSGEAGMTTAEYAVGTLAACGFAAVLYKVVTSGAVSSGLSDLIKRALDAGF